MEVFELEAVRNHDGADRVHYWWCYGEWDETRVWIRCVVIVYVWNGHNFLDE